VKLKFIVQLGAAHQRLKRNCNTRWVENQIAVDVFDELYSAVISVLTVLFESTAKSSWDAAMLLKSVIDPGFLVAVQVLGVVLSLTRPLSQSLQKKVMDLKSTVDSVDDCVAVLQSYRNGDIAFLFIELFNSAEEIHG